MYDKAIAALLLIVALIHIIPISGVLGASQLEALYGVELSEHGDLTLLMRHRAILFGILGGFFAYAAFVPGLQPLAFVAASVSVVSFLVLAAGVETIAPAIRTVIIADVVALLCLVIAIALHVLRRAGT